MPGSGSGSIGSSGPGLVEPRHLAQPRHLLQPHHPVQPGHLVEPLPLHTSGLQHFGWDLYLLVVSLALVWVGSRARVRGMGYVGGIGLLAFLLSVGAQITRIESGRAPTAAIVGWPLALLVIGVAGLAAPMLYRRES